MRSIVLFFAVLLPLLVPAAEPVSSIASLASELRNGGYIFFVRHPEASVGNDGDSPEWWKDCARQRLLSDVGKDQARRIGAGLRRLGTPLVVRTSEFCRALESVLFMGFREFTVTPALNHLNAWPREARMEDGIREAMRVLLATAPAAGTNTLLVGHVHNYARPVHEVLSTMNMGDTAIFKPDGRGGIRFVAAFPPEGWGP